MSVAATLRLLNTSLIIAISGGLRVYVAFLLLKVEPVPVLCLAACLIIYATYTLDRAVKTEEDEVNRKEESGANRRFALFIASASLLSAILILLHHEISLFVAFFPFIMGYMYCKGIKIGRFSIKLKRGFGIKNIVVAFTWSFNICSLIYPWAENPVELLHIFAFFFVKSFINSVICDCRDTKGDRLAGITTIPICLGEAKTKMLLHGIHSAFHLALAFLLVFDFIKFDKYILIFSWMAGVISIYLYVSKRIRFRSIVVHGEWIPMLGIRGLLLQLPVSASHSS